jgi:hypothetical protein
MSALFVSASSQSFSNASPAVTAPYPITVGAWVFFNSTGVAQSIWGLGDTATTTEYLYLGMTSSSKLSAVARSTAAGNIDNPVTTSSVIGAWTYVIGRYISATNRRIAVLHPGGLIENGNVSTSCTPLSLDKMAIGAQPQTTLVKPMNGKIAELWYCDADIQPDGGLLDSTTLLQLAYHGPFAHPLAVQNIVEYYGMASSSPIAPRPTEIYFNKYGPQAWIDTGSVQLAADHPPLPYEYDRPIPVARMLMI